MKRINDSKITSYETGHDDFIMDIVETSAGFGQPMFELWLYRAMTGYKKYIVGFQISQ